MLKTTQKRNYKDISLDRWVMTKDAYVYFGKQYYFEEDNGMIYSRLSHSYMTKDDALSEFLDEIQSYEW